MFYKRENPDIYDIVMSVYYLDWMGLIELIKLCECINVYFYVMGMDVWGAVLYFLRKESWCD